MTVRLCLGHAAESFSKVNATTLDLVYVQTYILKTSTKPVLQPSEYFKGWPEDSAEGFPMRATQKTCLSLYLKPTQDCYTFCFLSSK